MTKAYTKEEYMSKWPIDEIPDNIRELAVAWGEPFHLFIEDTVKLARDILETTEIHRKEYSKKESIAFAEYVTNCYYTNIPGYYSKLPKSYQERRTAYTMDQVYDEFIIQNKGK